MLHDGAAAARHSRAGAPDGRRQTGPAQAGQDWRCWVEEPILTFNVSKYEDSQATLMSVGTGDRLEKRVIIHFYCR